MLAGRGWVWFARWHSMCPPDRQELQRTVYSCQCCPEVYGFSRPAAGQPYYKFPPTIGATSQADLLFVGINPRRTGNHALHTELMADIGAFERLAANWDGRQPYIARGGPESHYQCHIGFVERVFGPGAKFEDHAAVTELFFCASANSKGLPIVKSPCADKHFEDVLRLVEPKAVVCVGVRVFRYFRERYGMWAGNIRISYGQGTAFVVMIPHPNAWISRARREQEIEAALGQVRKAVDGGVKGEDPSSLKLRGIW